MNIRPHRLLCIQKFTGHGYNEAFTKHMSSVKSLLETSQLVNITLVRGSDELCSMCPNNVNNTCVTLEKVSQMDERVLAVCGFKCGDSVRWADAAKTARKLVFETEKFNEICNSCQWFELCKNTKV